MTARINIEQVQEGVAAFAAASDIWYRLRYQKAAAEPLGEVVIPWIVSQARARLRDSLVLRELLKEVEFDRARLYDGSGRHRRLGEWVRGIDVERYVYLCQKFARLYDA